MSEYATIIFKSRQVFNNAFYVPWHDKLVELQEWIISIWDTPIIITSAYRPGDKGVHGTIPLRAVDHRGKGDKAQKKVNYINKHWEYDSSRPGKMVALLHNVGRGEHIHLQVHDNTVIKRGGYQKQKE